MMMVIGRFVVFPCVALPMQNVFEKKQDGQFEITPNKPLFGRICRLALEITITYNDDGCWWQ